MPVVCGVQHEGSRCAEVILEGRQRGVPVVHRFRHIQPGLVQPVLADNQAVEAAQLVGAANQREGQVLAVIGLDQLVDFGVLFQILFEVGGVLVNQIVQFDDVALLVSGGRAALKEVHVVDDVGQVVLAARNHQVELLFRVAGSGGQIQLDTGSRLQFLQEWHLLDLIHIGGQPDGRLTPDGKGIVAVGGRGSGRGTVRGTGGRRGTAAACHNTSHQQGCCSQ